MKKRYPHKYMQNFVTEELNIKCDNNFLRCYLFGKRKTGKGTILFCPGTSSVHKEHLDLIGILASEFNLILVIFRGQGKNTGKYSTHNALVDMGVIINTIEKYDFVDPNRIGIYGMCNGGVIAVFHASYDTRIKTLCLWETNPEYDWKDHNFIKKRFNKYKNKGIAVDPFSYWIAYNPIDVIHRVSCKTLVCGGDTEERVRVKEMKKMYSKLPNGKFKIIENAPHYVGKKHPKFLEYSDMILNWF